MSSLFSRPLEIHYARRRIGAVSRWLNRTCLFCIALVLAGNALFWVMVTPGSDWLPPEVIGKIGPDNLTLPVRTGGFLAGLIPAGAMIWGLFALARLFDSYARGDYFAPVTVKSFRHLGFAALFGSVAQILYGALVSPLVSLGNPPGERFLTVSVGTVNIGLLLLGFALIVVSWVMDEARKIDEEQRQFV